MLESQQHAYILEPTTIIIIIINIHHRNSSSCSLGLSPNDGVHVLGSRLGWPCSLVCRSSPPCTPVAASSSGQSAAEEAAVAISSARGWRSMALTHSNSGCYWCGRMANTDHVQRISLELWISPALIPRVMTWLRAPPVSIITSAAPAVGGSC